MVNVGLEVGVGNTRGESAELSDRSSFLMRPQNAFVFLGKINFPKDLLDMYIN